MDDLDPWPASDGLPEVADDDSYADPVREFGRDPALLAPLPPDRDDGPMGLDEYGILSSDRGPEPIDIRLARELPDFGARDPAEDPDPRLTEDLDPDEVDQVEEDTRLLAETEPIDPRLGSRVSMYDRLIPGIPFGVRLGELIRPGDGYLDDEPDEVALDLGPAPGGLGSEELAMHEMPPEQVDLEAAESTSEPYYIDMLGDSTLSNAMGYLIDSSQKEVKGLSFDPKAQGGDPLGDLGFSFRLYKGKDSIGWYSDESGGEEYSVANLYLDIAPVRISRPLYSPWAAR